MLDYGNMNLFMVLRKLNRAALSEMPQGFSTRFIRPEELDLWKAMHFDQGLTEAYKAFMDDFYARTYAPMGDLFFRRCLFVCDESDRPVGTCFAWKQYGQYQTLHWYKVILSHEGRGIGRALLSEVVSAVPEGEYPVYLHTQPTSCRAIKLYTDLGFEFLTNPVLDGRPNHLPQSIAYLKEHMPAESFARLRAKEYRDGLFVTAQLPGA